jgi:predicted GH43/DUF377 family glycosyl hydrolase
MQWRKLSLIWGPDGSQPWARHSALQPTSISLDDNTIRVYAALRDGEGVGRVGFVDVAGNDPTRVLRIAERPALNIGRPGAFDENGVVPTAVVARDGKLYLYYAGYMLGHKVRFIAFGGLAVSTDGGDTFERVHEAPITDRTDDELYFRVIHCLLKEDGVWRAWYGGGSRYISHDGQTLPVYDIRYMESPDGFTWPDHGRVVLTFEGEAEHRVGRPCVVKSGELYRMFYGAATKESNYRLAYAESHDGLRWTRKDKELGIEPTPGSWDSDMAAYPNFLRHGDQTYLFYNGNDYGRQGFGCAILCNW